MYLNGGRCGSRSGSGSGCGLNNFLFLHFFYDRSHNGSRSHHNGCSFADASETELQTCISVEEPVGVATVLGVELIGGDGSETFEVEGNALGKTEVKLHTTATADNVQLVLLPEELHFCGVTESVLVVVCVLILEAVDVTHTEDTVNGEETVGVVVAEDSVEVEHSVEAELTVVPLVVVHTIVVVIPAVLSFPAAGVETQAYGTRETIAHRESSGGRNGLRPLKVLTVSGSRATLKTDRPIRAEIILGRALCVGTESHCCESSYQKSSEFHNCGYIIELNYAMHSAEGAKFLRFRVQSPALFYYYSLQR